MAPFGPFHCPARDVLRTRLDMESAGTAIVSLPDPDGSKADCLAAAGIRAAGRGEFVRLAAALAALIEHHTTSDRSSADDNRVVVAVD